MGIRTLSIFCENRGELSYYQNFILLHLIVYIIPRGIIYIIKYNKITIKLRELIPSSTVEFERSLQL
jgi:hypothetical protein